MATTGKGKDPAAVALGRKGGKATAESLTKAERKESAKKAIEARWAAYYAANPDKLKSKKKAAKKKK
jgi:hypothetical protein